MIRFADAAAAWGLLDDPNYRPVKEIRFSIRRGDGPRSRPGSSRPRNRTARWPMLRAQYQQRGPLPQDVIEVVEFEARPLQAGQALVEVVATQTTVVLAVRPVADQETAEAMDASRD